MVNNTTPTTRGVHASQNTNNASKSPANNLLRTELVHEMESTVEYDCQTLIDQLLNPGLGELVTPANLTISGDRRQYERIIKAVLEECPKELGTLRKLAGAKTKDEKAMYPPLVSTALLRHREIFVLTVIVHYPDSYAESSTQHDHREVFSRVITKSAKIFHASG